MRLAHKLTPFELENLLAQMEWDYQRYKLVLPDEVVARYHQPARLEFPLGEITNPDIAGFILAWALQAAIRTTSIAAKDQFDAQGLEGKCVINTLLSSALLAARELLPYRRAIYIQLKLFESNLLETQEESHHEEETNYRKKGKEELDGTTLND